MIHTTDSINVEVVSWLEDMTAIKPICWPHSNGRTNELPKRRPHETEEAAAGQAQEAPRRSPCRTPDAGPYPPDTPDPGDADMHQAQGLPANLERLGFKETMEDER